MGDIGDELEDELMQGMGNLEVRDEETGECWTSQNLDMVGSYMPNLKPSKAAGCMRFTASRGPWKIPKQYSQLGVDTTEDNKPAEMMVDTDSSSMSVEEASGETAIVAKFPTPGKLPWFCRKRKCPLPTATSPTANKFIPPCKVERFLEGREWLSMVGRLLFAFFMLLSPGYVFSIVVFIRAYCHVQRHNNCTGEDEETMSTLTSGNIFPFLRKKTFLSYSCRVCRENLKSEKMFKIHLNMGPPLANRPKSPEDSLDNEGICECHNHSYG